MFAAGETVVVVRAAGRDRNGDQTGSPVETTVPGCAVWPAGTAEVQQASTQVTADLTVMLPPGTDIVATDQVRVRGQLYRVTGQPADYRSPLTGALVLTADLKRVTG